MFLIWNNLFDQATRGSKYSRFWLWGLIAFLTPPKNNAIRIGYWLRKCCAQIDSNRGFMLDTSGTHIFHANPAFQPSFMLTLLFPQQLVGRPASPSGHQAWLCSTGSKRSKPGWLPQRPGHRLPNRTPPSRRR